MTERNAKLVQLNNFLDTRNVLTRCLFVRQNLITTLREIASEIELSNDGSREWGVEKQMLYHIASPRHKEVNVIDCKNNKIPVPEYLLGATEELVKTLKCEFDAEKAQCRDIANLLAEMSQLFNGIFTGDRPYDRYLHGYGVIIEHLKFVGLNNLGLTVELAPEFSIGINPDALANALEEELKLLETNSERNPQEIQLHCYRILRIELEAFTSVRTELVKALKLVEEVLNVKNRNVSISTIVSSSSGLAGGGLALVGVALLPFTAGTSIIGFGCSRYRDGCGQRGGSRRDWDL